MPMVLLSAGALKFSTEGEHGTLISECNMSTQLRRRLSSTYLRPGLERIRVVRAAHCACEQPINGEKKLPAQLPSVFSFSFFFQPYRRKVSACNKCIIAEAVAKWRHSCSFAGTPHGCCAAAASHRARRSALHAHSRVALLVSVIA